MEYNVQRRNGVNRMRQWRPLFLQLYNSSCQLPQLLFETVTQGGHGNQHCHPSLCQTQLVKREEVYTDSERDHSVAFSQMSRWSISVCRYNYKFRLLSSTYVFAWITFGYNLPSFYGMAFDWVHVCFSVLTHEYEWQNNLQLNNGQLCLAVGSTRCKNKNKAKCNGHMLTTK